uniref:Uncharacterized protein n=1 Tax=Tetraselmis sp. GSL018 TaxID=582737 RepID=A0A061S8P5_9CHLO
MRSSNRMSGGPDRFRDDVRGGIAWLGTGQERGRRHGGACPGHSRGGSRRKVLLGGASQLPPRSDEQCPPPQKVVDAVLGLFRQRSDIAASLANTDSMMNSLETGFAGRSHRPAPPPPPSDEVLDGIPER